MQPATVLTIAGSDSGGGAGLQADLKAFALNGVFGTSVVTVLTAQNSAEIRAIEKVPAAFVTAQLDAVLADLPVAAVKTGMLASEETVRAVAGYAPRLPNLVVDPVLVNSDGVQLFPSTVDSAYLEGLFPHAAVITPNLREASLLTGRKIISDDDMAAAATELAATGAGCVVGGGGGGRPGIEAVDAVWHEGSVRFLRSPWVGTRNNHGTGCTFAATTAALLAQRVPVQDALDRAKRYVQAALERGAAWQIGSGHGPLGWPTATDH
ncbi:bifunctional hydroxymethylpyrimidine kinase/phosphomethylpyrimidine kinase [Virgisporangium aurantiacum]